jgi:hypothetical protein
MKFILLIIIALLSAGLYSSQKAKSSDPEKVDSSFQAIFDNYLPGKISIDSLLKVERIKVIALDNPDSILNSENILGFVIATASSKGRCFIENTPGNQISDSAKLNLAGLVKGDIILIAKIQFKKPHGSVVFVQSSKYTLE